MSDSFSSDAATMAPAGVMPVGPEGFDAAKDQRPEAILPRHASHVRPG